MPTASQAMILMTEEGNSPEIPQRRYSSMSHLKSERPENVPKTTRSHQIFEQPQKGKQGPGACPGTTPQQIILQGYRGNMFYDQETRRFRWQVISKGNNVSDDLLTATSIDYDIPEDKPPPPQIITRSTKLLSRRGEMAGNSADNITTTNEWRVVNDKSYDRLEGLGFRRRFIAAPSKVSPPLARHRGRTTSSPTVSARYDESSRPHPAINHRNREGPYRGIPKGDFNDEKKANQEKGGCEIEHEVSQKTLSLLDEIKQKVGYGHRIFPAMYMRRSYPMEQPLSMCFSLPDDSLSHVAVKRWVEASTGLNVAAVQYDPVSVRAGVAMGSGSRWIVTMTSLEDCRKLLRMGLEVDGEKVIVKWLDDVCVCEFDAYKIHCQEQKRMHMKSLKRKPKSERSLIKSF